MKLQYKLLHPDAKAPTKAYAHDAGYDLYTIESGMIFGPMISMNEAPDDASPITSFRTGISLAIPEGYVGIIAGRSGLAKRCGIFVLGGILDSGYRGEVSVMLSTVSDEVLVTEGDKIAQILIMPVANFELEEVSELPSSERGIRGFGSSDLVAA